MGHITDQYGPYYRPIWAILLTHPQPLPEGGGAEGEAREGIIAPLNKVLTLEKVKTILLFARLIVPLENVLPLGKAKNEDFSAFFFCFALT